MWRRKCGVIQEKYQNMKNVFHKDKFIGRPREDDNSYPKERKLNQSMSTRNVAMLEEVNNMIDTFEPKLKRGFSYEEQI